MLVSHGRLLLTGTRSTFRGMRDNTADKRIHYSELFPPRLSERYTVENLRAEVVKLVSSRVKGVPFMGDLIRFFLKPSRL